MRLESLVADRIGEELQRRIVQGVYVQGSLIPPERTLAKEFACSRSTVSRALAGLARGGLIERRPGRGTRVLPLGGRATPALLGIAHSLTEPFGPFAALIIQGIQQTLSRMGQRHELIPYSQGEDRIGAEAIATRYGGVVFVEAPPHKEAILELHSRGFPYVVANLEIAMDVVATGVDHRRAARDAVRFLAAMGHERIALITSPPERLFYGTVIAAYRDALDALHLPQDPDLLLPVPESNAFCAYTTLRGFLAEHPAPTALIAARDWIAQGACQALTETGLVIGRDVSVVGFDDISWPESRGFLTTFAEPLHRTGAEAAEMLVERIVSGRRDVEQRWFDAPLVLRSSAGPVRRDTPATLPRVLLRLENAPAGSVRAAPASVENLWKTPTPVLS